MNYLVTLSICLSLCFVAQAFALRAVGGRTAKSESNFFSSLGRIQAGAYGKADAMLLGSSITGRLPDRAQGYAGWSNMGCDGGSAVDALRAMDAGILPTASLLVIEANTLQLALDEKPTEIGQSMRGIWFATGMKYPLLSAYARPSAFLYSKLLERKTGSFKIPAGEDLAASGHPEIITAMPAVQLTRRESELIQEMCDILERLRKKGSKAVIVWLPPARGDDAPPPPWILELARQCDIPYWDLGQQAADGSVILTDSVHMAAPSAARTIRTLQKVLTTR
jgi:hypothetical protein